MSRTVAESRGAGRRGSAIVEFALGSSVLLALFSGTFEFGYTLVQYNRLGIAVAQGARYAALIPYDSASSTPSPAFLAAVRNMVLYGTPAAGAAPVVGGLRPEEINLNITFANGVPASMKVSISGYRIHALFGSHSLNGKPQATYPYQGIWSPV